MVRWESGIRSRSGISVGALSRSGIYRGSPGFADRMPIQGQDRNPTVRLLWKSPIRRGNGPVIESRLIWHLPAGWRAMVAARRTISKTALQCCNSLGEQGLIRNARAKGLEAERGSSDGACKRLAGRLEICQAGVRTAMALCGPWRGVEIRDGIDIR